MPSPRIILLTLICVAVVASAFWVVHQPEEVTYRAEEGSELVALETSRQAEGSELVLFRQREEGETNPADPLIQEALSKYMELKDSKEAVDPEVLRESFRPDFGSIFPEEMKEYTLGDISTTPASGQAAKDDYYHQLEETLKKNTPDGDLENEYLVFLRYLENRNPSELEKIDPILEGYKNILKDLLAMETPEEIAQEHLEFVNALNVLVINIKALREYPENSIAGFISMGQYGNAAANMMNTLGSLVESLLPAV